MTARASPPRRVVAIQHGRAIFNLQASFHVPEEGLEHGLPMPDVADPETLPDFKERMAPYKEMMGDWYERPRPIDLRYVEGDPMSRRGESSVLQRACGCERTGVCPTTPSCMRASSRTRVT